MGLGDKDNSPYNFSSIELLHPCFERQPKQPMIMKIAPHRTNHVAGIELQPRQVTLTHTAQSVGAAAHVPMFGLLHKGGRLCIDAVTEHNLLRAVFLFCSLSLLLQVSALKAPPLAQLRPLSHCNQGVANKTLIRASAVVSGPKRQCEANRVEYGVECWCSGVVVRCGGNQDLLNVVDSVPDQGFFAAFLLPLPLWEGCFGLSL